MVITLDSASSADRPVLLHGTCTNPSRPTLKRSHQLAARTVICERGRGVNTRSVSERSRAEEVEDETRLDGDSKDDDDDYIGVMM